MSMLQNKIMETRFTGESFFVPGYLPPEDVWTVSASGLVLSFKACATEFQGPQFSVFSDWSDWSDKSDYTVIAETARSFRGWLTVTADAVIRNAVRVFRRIVCEAKAVFNRHVLIRQGGLRL